MPAEVLWLKQARADLVELAARIAVDNPQAASRIVRRMNTRALSLGDFPQLGVRRENLGPGLRILADGPHLLVYRTVPDVNDDAVRNVEIVAIVDGRRDLGRVLQGREA